MSSIACANEDATPEENGENSGHGGYFANSHHANRHEAENARETGGEDTVYIGVGVFWKYDFDALMEQLETAKKAAQEYHDPIQHLVSNELLTVYPSGASTGSGHGSFYRYRVRLDGIAFKISHHVKPIEETPNVIVEIGSEACMVYRGLSEVWAEIKNILEKLGGYVLWNKLSRADFCVELPGVDIGLFVDPVLMNRQYVSRARDDTFYRDCGAFTGFSVGKGIVQMRIYNKAYEVQVKRPNPAKLKLLEKYRWGGPQETAVRVEFQLMRDALRELGLADMESYYANRAAVMKYLTEDWFRMTSIVPDRENNNTHRAPTHELWKRVQHDFQSWAGRSEQTAVRDYRSTVRDPIRLLKQGGGCCMGVVAELTQERDLDREQLRHHVQKAMDWYLDAMTPGEVIRKYRKSSEKRIATTPNVEVIPMIDTKTVPWVQDMDDAGVLRRAGMPIRTKPNASSKQGQVEETTGRKDNDNGESEH
jgi:hypothetical protein